MKKCLGITTLICLIAVMVFIQGCKKATLPKLTTTEVTNITINSAVSGGEITSDGGESIIERGVCWNTSGEPTVADSKTSDGKGSGDFASNLTGLQPVQTYSVRAYATNSVGTAYGEEFSFYTKIADVDGNQYAVVLIGSQMWMAENLKTTKYKDGTSIPGVTGNTAWINLTSPAYCWYGNDEATNKSIYGAIYNWYAVATSKLCPTGWHVATDAEYVTLELGLGLPAGEANTWEWRGTDQGKKMKNITGWNTNENGTNTSGFSALPSGYRYYVTGQFAGLGILGYWWTSSEEAAGNAWYRRLDGSEDGVYKAATSKKAGKSVRCIRD